MSKKISIEDAKKAMGTDYIEFIDMTWRGVDLHIRQHLSLRETMEFVHGAVGACFAAETNEYLPEIKDFAIRCSILEMYAGLELPEDAFEKYELVYTTDIVEFVVQSIERDQFNNILASIDKKIEYLTQCNIEAINKQMNIVMDNLAALEAQLSAVFGGIDSETITKVAGIIADGAFDESKFVKAFMQNKNVVEDTTENVVQMLTKDE